MEAEYWPWPLCSQKSEDKSDIKQLRYRASIFARMKSVSVRQLSSGKIIGRRPPLFKRRGFKDGLEAFRSRHLEQHDGNAKNNARLESQCQELGGVLGVCLRDLHQKGQHFLCYTWKHHQSQCWISLSLGDKPGTTRQSLRPLSCGI